MEFRTHAELPVSPSLKQPNKSYKPIFAAAQAAPGAWIEVPFDAVSGWDASSRRASLLSAAEYRQLDAEVVTDREKQVLFTRIAPNKPAD